MLQLQTIINSKDWINIYESCENDFVKDIMKEWGIDFFPNDYKF